MRFQHAALVVVALACRASPLPPTSSARYAGATLHFAIIDSTSRKPVALASVVLKGFGFGALTDSAGEAWLFGVPPGTYSVDVQTLQERCPLSLAAPPAITVADDSAQTFLLVTAPRSGCIKRQWVA